MRRLALAFATAGAFLGLLRLRCAIRGRHAPVRHFLGGFRCSLCLKAGTDLEEMGFDGGGYVPPRRRTFDRKHATVTQEYVQ